MGLLGGTGCSRRDKRYTHMAAARWIEGQKGPARCKACERAVFDLVTLSNSLPGEIPGFPKRTPRCDTRPDAAQTRLIGLPRFDDLVTMRLPPGRSGNRPPRRALAPHEDV